MKTKLIIVLIDAVSSGRLLKQTVIDKGFDLILINTLSPEQLLGAGKDAGPAVRVIQEFYLSDVDQMQLCLMPFKQLLTAIIGASEPAVAFADELASRFGLAGNSPATTKFRRNKFQMREALKDTDYIVNYRCCSTVAQVADFLKTNAAPVVVKALNSAGNDHVYFCQNKTEVLSAAQKALGSVTIFGDTVTQVLVEEYIAGELLIVEFFVNRAKFLVTSIWAMEMIELQQTNTRIFKNAKRLDQNGPTTVMIGSIAKEMAQRTGIVIGPGLLELKFDPDRNQYKLIEIGSRLSGIDLPLIQQQTTNFDPYQEILNCFVNPNYNLPDDVTLKGHAEIYFIPVITAGKLREIRGLDTIEKLPSFHSKKIFIKTGSWIDQTRDQATLAAVFYLIHPSDQQIQQDKQMIDQFFKLIYE